MFNEDEDWSDEQDAQDLSRTVLRNSERANSSRNVKVKAVGKKSLLRTLQTLGSVPEWKSDEHQQDSDSEPEAAPSQSKRKKKRRKRRKQADPTGEQQENGDLDQTVQEEKPVAKKRKKKDNKSGAPDVKTTSLSETKEKDMTVSTKVNVNKPQKPERLSRQQWKNKMKNKRRCKNKYSQNKNKPEEDVNKPEPAEKHKPKEEVKIDSCSNDSSKKNSQTPAKKKEKERKPQKGKKAEEDTDVSCTTETPREEKQLSEKEKKTKGCKVEKRATESSSDGSKPEAEVASQITDNQDQSATKKLKPEHSKELNLKKEKLRKMLHSQETIPQESPVEMDEPAAPTEEVKLDRSASLRLRMEQRLESARFRYINEVLYSTSSGEAKRMFKQDPQAFGIYHRGYTAQVQKWPVNPVDEIISYIRQKPSSLVVADFGCGDCKIARSVKNKVHSFDLAAACELVTVCDMANVPLRDGSVNIVVFCLSLMGTNLADFLSEANRVLKMGGFLKIAEVASRFENVRSFITALAGLGFKMVSKDTENTHFYSFELVKTADSPENVKKFGLQLKPCVYKKR